jgi:2-oxoglutarate ferredoxin oxidoreductase subunit alpha
VTVADRAPVRHAGADEASDAETEAAALASPSATSPADPASAGPAPAPSASAGTVRPVLMKGNEAMAEAAIAAGCDAYFGYPITPQAELLERMARRMPELGRVFVQAESELAAINMGLGAAATGARVLVTSSSPGISLMAEGMSYLAGSELPLVLINVMRGGPGLGSIGPSQSDYFQATKGHGHGDYRVPVLAPSTIDEAVALIADAFEIAERYRTPVMLLPDGVLGQAMEPVAPVWRMPPRLPNDWELGGAAGRAPRVIRSLNLRPEDLEAHNVRLQAKYATIAEREVRYAAEDLDDAEIAVVAYGTAARVARTAIDRAREAGLPVGLLRPITLWPFPSQAIAQIAPRLRAIVVVEMSAGQMVEDVRLAAEGRAPIFFHGRTGGMVPMPGEVLRAIRRAWAMTSSSAGHRRTDPGRTADRFADDIIRAGDEVRAAAEPDPLSLIELAEWRAVEGPLADWGGVDGPIAETEEDLDPFRLLFAGEGGIGDD